MDENVIDSGGNLFFIDTGFYRTNNGQVLRLTWTANAILPPGRYTDCN